MFFILLSLILGNVQAQTQVETPVAPSAEEIAFLQIINDFRTELNLPALEIDPRLTEAANRHAQWMANKNFLTHAGPRIGWGSWTRMYAQGIEKGTLVGENIARGSFSAKNTFIQWFFSSIHLGGMLTADYTHVGISRRGCDGIDDQKYCFWVTDFADLSEPAVADEFQTSTCGKDHPKSYTYGDEHLIHAAEMVVGELDSEKKANFENPTTP